MGWKSEHKQQTRERIVRCAARLFTQRGFDRVGIDDVMGEAGLTRGAFYAYFQSKSELYVEAIVSGAMAARRCVVEHLPEKHSIEHVAERYLSAEHREGLMDSCPLAFLTTDIQQRDEQVRAACTRVFDGFVTTVK